MSADVRYLAASLALWSVFSGCAQTPLTTSEYINAPLNLTVSLVGAQTYQLTFNSDNREGAFSGYGVFSGSTTSAVSAEPASGDITLALGFCPLTGQTSLSVGIQVGPAAAGIAAGTSICDLTGVTLISGGYVAVRGRVDRAEKQWSKPAIQKVP